MSSLYDVTEHKTMSLVPFKIPQEEKHEEKPALFLGEKDTINVRFNLTKHHLLLRRNSCPEGLDAPLAKMDDMSIQSDPISTTRPMLMYVEKEIHTHKQSVTMHSPDEDSRMLPTLPTRKTSSNRTVTNSSAQQTSMSRFGNWKALIQFCEQINTVTNDHSKLENAVASAGAAKSSARRGISRQKQIFDEKETREISLQSLSSDTKSSTSYDEDEDTEDAEELKLKLKIAKLRRKRRHRQTKKTRSRSQSEEKKKFSKLRNDKRSSSADAANSNQSIIQRAAIGAHNLSIALPIKFQDWRQKSRNRFAALRNPKNQPSPLMCVVASIDTWLETGELKLGHAQRRDPHRESITGRIRLGLHRSGSVVSLRIIEAEIELKTDAGQTKDLQVYVTVTKNNIPSAKFITGTQPCSNSPKFEQKFVLDAVLNCWIKIALRETLSSIKERACVPRGVLIGEVLVDVNEVDEENYVSTWFPLML